MNDNEIAERAEQRAIDEWEASKELEMKDRPDINGAWYVTPRQGNAAYMPLWGATSVAPGDIPVRVIPQTLEERTRLHVLFTTLLTGIEDTVEGRARAATLILDSLRITAQPRVSDPNQEALPFSNEVAA